MSDVDGNDLREVLRLVVEGHPIPAGPMERVMERILGGVADPLVLGALAVAMRMRGETADEVAAAARVLRRHCQVVDLGELPDPILDTCGTGGDGSGSFNVSTVSAIAVAALGVKVAKHGNRAVSSRCGSADVLEALGVHIELAPDAVLRCVKEVGIGFLFAPAHHAALRHAAPVRRALGVRTFFNLLGPLANPAGATHQLLGVYDPERIKQMAHALSMLGTRAAWVVHGEGGLDEVSPHGPTQVAELISGQVRLRTVRPEDFGLRPAGREAIAGGTPEENADIARRVLRGADCPQRVAVVINAAAALVVVGMEPDLRRAADRVASALDDGSAIGTLDRWAALTAELSE